MKGISKVKITKLFWDTLEDFRGTREYRLLRAAVPELMARKFADAGPSCGGDRPFTGEVLKGIWHLKVVSDPHVVIFYVQQRGVLELGMVGTHRDYSFKGVNKSSDPRTARRIWNAIDGDHVPSPLWKAPTWKRPADLTDDVDINEYSQDALEELLAALHQEFDDAPAFRRLRGRELGDGPNGERDLDEWVEETQEAVETVTAAIERKPMSGEDWMADAVATVSSRGPR